MPNANGALITVVKTTETGQVFEEETLPFNKAFDVVVEAEAGTNVFNSQQSYVVQIVLTDLNTSTVVAAKKISGSVGDANWPARAQNHRFAVPAPGAGAEDHVYRAFGVLQIGKIDPIIDYEESDILVITA
jgi:hypothetical protein